MHTVHLALIFCISATPPLGCLFPLFHVSPSTGPSPGTLKTSQTFVATSDVLCVGQLNNVMHLQVWVVTTASKSSIRRFVITEKAPTRAFSWLKAATTAFTFRTLLRLYAKWALTPRSLNVKLGPRRKYHKGRAVCSVITNLRMELFEAHCSSLLW